MLMLRNSSRLLLLVMILIAGLIVSIGVYAQSGLDFSLPPNYGSVQLQAGTLPEPHSVTIVSGGDLDIATLGLPATPGAGAGFCAGFATSPPDYRVVWSGEAEELIFFWESTNIADTTIVISGPSSEWYCDDDSAGNFNPAITLRDPLEGQYDIWIGNWAGVNVYTEGALFVTDDSSLIGERIQYNPPYYNPPPSWQIGVPEYDVYLHETYFSERHNTDVGYSIYLPESYATETERVYPIMYWLHGPFGTERTGVGSVAFWISAMQTGLLPETVIVMPNGFYNSNYCDCYGEFALNAGLMGVQPESTLINELMPHIDSSYRVGTEQAHRMIAGFSMGGYGAVRLALRHPDLFASVVSVDGYLFPRGVGNLNEPSFNFEESIQDANSVNTLLRENIEGASSMEFFLTGSLAFTAWNDAFHTELTANNIYAELHIRDLQDDPTVFMSELLIEITTFQQRTLQRPQ